MRRRCECPRETFQALLRARRFFLTTQSRPRALQGITEILQQQANERLCLMDRTLGGQLNHLLKMERHFGRFACKAGAA